MKLLCLIVFNWLNNILSFVLSLMYRNQITEIEIPEDTVDLPVPKHQATRTIIRLGHSEMFHGGSRGTDLTRFI